MPIEIPRKDWPTFLGAFGHEHLGWRVTLESHRPGRGKLFEAEASVLQDVTDEHAGGHEQIAIVTGGGAAQARTHIVDDPTRLVLLGEEPQPELEIDSGDGTITVISCSAPQNNS